MSKNSVEFSLGVTCEKYVLSRSNRKCLSRTNRKPLSAERSTTRWKSFGAIGEGQSFGGPDQNARNPRGNPTRWTSTHSARWHTGKFFLIQDEWAQVDGPFDILSVMGWDDGAGRYFARAFENHGFYRHYDVTVEGNVWTISGKTERARIEFSDDRKRQTITWEWRPQDAWLPLCDRIATKL